jgi:HSP20 family molecular chaperone IbpA
VSPPQERREDDEVTADQIEARYTDGMLEVQVPVPAQAPPTAEKFALQYPTVP